MEEGKECAGLLNESARCAASYTVERRALFPVIFQTQVRHHPEKTSAVRDRDLPRKSRKIGERAG